MCVSELKHSPDLSLDYVAFPALKEDKLLSLSKSPTVIRGGRACLEVHLIRAQIIPPSNTKITAIDTEDYTSIVFRMSLLPPSHK